MSEHNFCLNAGSTVSWSVSYHVWQKANVNGTWSTVGVVVVKMLPVSPSIRGQMSGALQRRRALRFVPLFQHTIEKVPL